MTLETHSQTAGDIFARPHTGPASIGQYAQTRLAALQRDRSARREAVLLAGLFVVLFAPAIPSWWQRWSWPDSPQGYARFGVPLVLLWLWAKRFRLMVPGISALIQLLGEHGALRVLLTERLARKPRPLWLLGLGCAMTPVAYWLDEPALTYLAFLVLVTGLVCYRSSRRLLREAVFPLLILLILLPVPGLVIDAYRSNVQPDLFHTVTQILQNVGVHAALSPAGNPMLVSTGAGTPEASSVRLYGAVIGTGVAEAILAFLLCIWLSVTRQQRNRDSLQKRSWRSCSA